MRLLKSFLVSLSAVVFFTFNTLSASAADIVDTAVEAGSFETLVTAVKAADLVDTLKGEGPYTVFAPTDEAFAALPEGTVESLLQPENKAKLTSILLYHVAAGNVTSDQIQAGSLKSAEGSNLSITVDEGVKVDNANVVKADIEADNGVIHVVDQVLLP
ncbi:fasciclin domain-containing protein [Dactylococcopsis salina]|uniref:Secreted/surface protein with fasciclin-like repeats n=1 Tax=Dactylococcopsis salina (strain PCC 8305) TaxID=13035 RepID=K9YYF0_DACS8|nr:fasciclin domain-containing protein [Dactylococcopsis salina]AFZ51976.1 secreted/surface protein with fasciclin-like repeats [Dactylococcopsis salina PCC 8305]